MELQAISHFLTWHQTLHAGFTMLRGFILNLIFKVQERRPGVTVVEGHKDLEQLRQYKKEIPEVGGEKAG